MSIRKVGIREARQRFRRLLEQVSVATADVVLAKACTRLGVKARLIS